jgi:hypothetical protein
MKNPGWQVTATTIYCDAVEDEATLIIKSEDESIVCTIYPKIRQPYKKQAAEMGKKSQKLDRQLKCEGPLCWRMIEYRNRSFDEDKGEKAKG